MEQITISGTLLTKAETDYDKKGRKYTRFTVTCGSEDIHGRTQFTHYRCICYVGGYEKLVQGDQVFLTGRLSASIGTDSFGKNYLNLNVMVHQASGGYRASERKKEKK